ncbi:MAG TPA: nicotinate-nucleotide--dimethylbenzimidazole phosphoribosyltransferase [Gemmataceae bacterium]|nr:nicotinate-nucleotide--dimethylbenzimidazole phosphoribosyltransferase [Gemmataceae bacterium]
MTLLEETCRAIVPVDDEAARRMQQLLDDKTKPRGSLGVLEDLACRMAAIYRTEAPPLPRKAVVVMAADHGVAEEGVSAYPSEVTAQMVQNFAAGGAAINVLARQAEARVVVVDMGVRGVWRAGSRERLESSHHSGRSRDPARQASLGSGTANFTRGPAMSKETAVRGLEIGIGVAGELAAEGTGLLGIGDMGIANTTSASALTAVLCGEAVERVTGRGTGIDDAGRQRKIQAIERALAVNRPNPADPLDVLAKVGGFEIAGLAGVLLGAAARRLPVLLDGFITGAAALIAVRLCPAVRGYLIASHRSVEPGHQAILRDLELRPLLDLDLRLGEGTGAVLAMYLVEASLRIAHEMATFTAAGVTSIP